MDNFEEEDHGINPQEAIAEGLLDFPILNKPPEIHQGVMLGDKYYDSKNEDMSRASMNTAVWQDKVMGLEGGVKVRENAKRGNDLEAPGHGQASTADIDASSNAEDAGTTQDKPPPTTDQAGNAVAQED